MRLKADQLRVIVLMLENRSFDHLLGFLDHPSERYPRLTGNESNPDAQGKLIKVQRGAQYTIQPGPDHSHAGVRLQLFGELAPYAGKKPTNSGFVTSYDWTCLTHGVKRHGADIMNCFRPDEVPVLSTLAKEFAVCVNWFSSVPGATWPNRNFAHAGTSDGQADIVYRFYDNKTVFEQLHQRHRTWSIYHDGFPQTWVFPKLIKQWGDQFRSMEEFYEDIRRDRLPDYSFIEPQYMGLTSNSMHPEYVGADELRFRRAERLVSGIYGALTTNEKVWNKTVFLVTFDEHGGFFDRVPPPRAARPDNKVWLKGMAEEFRFDLLGLRVPAIVVSPRVQKGTIDTTRYDHTSIIRTLREAFMPGSKPLTRRDAAAHSFLHLLNLEDDPRDDAPDVGPSDDPNEPIPWASDPALRQQHRELDEFQQHQQWLGEEVSQMLDGKDPSAGATKPPPQMSLGSLDEFEKEVVRKFRRKTR